MRQGSFIATCVDSGSLRKLRIEGMHWIKVEDLEAIENIKGLQYLSLVMSGTSRLSVDQLTHFCSCIIERNPNLTLILRLVTESDSLIFFIIL